MVAAIVKLIYLFQTNVLVSLLVRSGTFLTLVEEHIIYVIAYILSIMYFHHP